jgi:replication factor C subunit 3/5
MSSQYLIDKYSNIKCDDIFNKSPENLNMYFHQEIYDNLKKMSRDDEIPHIIFYGNKGSGKKTLIKNLLEMIYDKTISNLENNIYEVKGSGGKPNLVNIRQSDYHIIIEPNNNNFDKYLIQEIVKEYAKKMPLNIFEGNRSFKVVQINKLDNLSEYAQMSLRRTIEKYSKNCRFISWCHTLSKISEPLRSRCLCIHVPVQPKPILLKWLMNICYMEKMNLDFRIINEIMNSDGNLKTMIWKLDLYKHKKTTITSYWNTINAIIYDVINNCDITNIRKNIYSITTNNILTIDILKDMLNIILSNNKLNKIQQSKIIEYAIDCNYNLSKARYEIIHLEKFVINVYTLIN